MNTILAFGDSLTWGSDPATGGRHAREDRWPVAMASALKGRAEVVTDAVRGRSTVFDDWSADCDRNGLRSLPTALYAHAPVDLVILMLGTNDMKPFLCGNAFATARGMARLVSVIRAHDPGLADATVPDILIVAPPPLVETADAEKSAIFAGVEGESRKLASLYHDLADETDCAFFDASSVASASPLDGVHLDAENSRTLGQALAPIVALTLGL